MIWWEIAAQAVGSILQSRSSRRGNDRETREDREFRTRLAQFEAANRRAELEADRRWQLENRRYNEEAIGGFRRYARPDMWSPEYSNTDPSRIEAPEFPDNKKNPKKPTRTQGMLG